jgi:hypothetical protein
MAKRVEAQITKPGPVPITATKNGQKDEAKDGAIATAGAKDAHTAEAKELRQTDFVKWITPRIPGQPWTAPAYDDALNVPSQSPRIFCALFGGGEDVNGQFREPTCSCMTEQGTKHVLDRAMCKIHATEGVYNPFLDEVEGDRKRLDDVTQRRELSEYQSRGVGQGPTATVLDAGTMIEGEQVTGYGDIKAGGG